jgi:hypothetical protein
VSDVITTQEELAATPAQLSYLADLMVERYGDTVDVAQFQGRSKSYISGLIKRVLKEDGTVPASTESQDEVIALAAKLGYSLGSLVPNATQAGVNRQLRDLRKRVSRAEYFKGAADFDSFLTSLTAGEAKELSDEIPF